MLLTHRLPCILVVALFLLVCASSSFANDAVTLQLQIRDEANLPISNMGVIVSDSIGVEVVRSATDTSGAIQLSIPRARANRFVTLYIGDLELPGETLAQSLPRSRRYQELINFRHMPTDQVVLIPAAATEINVDLTATPGVRATVCVNDSSGTIVGASIRASTSALFGATSQPPTQPCAVLRGLAPGQDAILRADGSGSSFLLFSVPGATLTQDSVLGTVTLPPEGGDATVTCAFTNTEPGDFVSFIAADGGSGHIIILAGPSATLNLPAGNYYVIPDTFEFTYAFWPFVAALRGGQHAQIDAAGVPKVTAVAGQTTDLTVNLDASRDAMISIAVP